MKYARRGPEDRSVGEVLREHGLLDPWLLTPVAVIFALSASSLYGVIYSDVAQAADPLLADRWFTPWGKHIVSFVLGMALYALAARTRPSTLRSLAPWLYGATLLLLLATPFLAPSIRGTRAWIRLGPLSLQTAEIAKPFLLLFLATRLSECPPDRSPIRGLAEAVGIVGLPVGLILLQPDMGTALTDLSLLLTLPFLAGLPSGILTFALLLGGSFLTRLLVGIAQREVGVLPPHAATRLLLEPSASLPYLAVLFVASSAWAWFRPGREDRWIPLRATVAIAIGVAASFVFEDHLAAHQRRRLITVWAPESDPKGSGYNVIQSTLAVGSGGLFGQGWRGATQSVLGYLPEEETDFAFSVLAEVFGFVGVSIVLGCFAILLARLVSRAGTAPDRFSGLLAMGAATYFGVHLFVNAGMCVGLMPVIGVPLPFVSAGGSATLGFCLLLGLVRASYRSGG